MKIGDKVICRFFNWPDGEFYGEEFDGEIIDIDYDNYGSRKSGVQKPYLIKRLGSFDIWMAIKEIRSKGDKQ